MNRSLAIDGPRRLTANLNKGSTKTIDLAIDVIIVDRIGEFVYGEIPILFIVISSLRGTASVVSHTVRRRSAKAARRSKEEVRCLSRSRKVFYPLPTSIIEPCNSSRCLIDGSPEPFHIQATPERLFLYLQPQELTFASISHFCDISVLVSEFLSGSFRLTTLWEYSSVLCWPSLGVILYSMICEIAKLINACRIPTSSRVITMTRTDVPSST